MFDKLLEKVNEQLGEEDFRSEVDLHVHVKDIEDAEEINIVDKKKILTYTIDVEYRSWGIKDISVMPKGVIEFEVEILDADDKVIKTLPVKIDFSTVDCSIEWMEGKSYDPSDLEVYLTKDGKIEEVTLSFYFIHPDWW
jgi:hypothetical protein